MGNFSTKLHISFQRTQLTCKFNFTVNRADQLFNKNMCEKSRFIWGQFPIFELPKKSGRGIEKA